MIRWVTWQKKKETMKSDFVLLNIRQRNY